MNVDCGQINHCPGIDTCCGPVWVSGSNFKSMRFAHAGYLQAEHLFSQISTEATGELRKSALLRNKRLTEMLASLLNDLNCNLEPQMRLSLLQLSEGDGIRQTLSKVELFVESAFEKLLAVSYGALDDCQVFTKSIGELGADHLSKLLEKLENSKPGDKLDAKVGKRLQDAQEAAPSDPEKQSDGTGQTLPPSVTICPCCLWGNVQSSNEDRCAS